jgi:hypothetical protein
VGGYGCMSATAVQPRKTMRAGSRRSQVTTRLLLLLGGVLLNWVQRPRGAEAAEVQASFATCGDKDGDGPGTEPVTDADCAAIQDGYAARASSFDTVLNGREWDGAAWTDDFNACCEQGWEECENAMSRGDICPDGMGFKPNMWNMRCPEQPCDLTPGGADVEICCSEPVCRFYEMPRGYSAVEVISDCVTGYVAGDYWTPSTTCPTGCTLTRATYPQDQCVGDMDADGLRCHMNQHGNACAVATGDCVFVAAGIETCEDTVDSDYWAVQYRHQMALSELPEISCADGYTGTANVTCAMGGSEYYEEQTSAYGGNFEYSGCAPDWNLPQELGQAEASTCASDVCGIGYVPKADQTLAAGTEASVANCCDAIVGGGNTSRPSAEQCSIRTLFSSVYGPDGSEPFSAQGSSALETFRTHCRDWIASRNFNLKVGTSCANERTCDVLGLLDDTSSYIEVCREVWLSMCSASPQPQPQPQPWC